MIVSSLSKNRSFLELLHQECVDFELVLLAIEIIVRGEVVMSASPKGITDCSALPSSSVCTVNIMQFLYLKTASAETGPKPSGTENKYGTCA
jgi:hypothetical protein